MNRYAITELYLREIFFVCVLGRIRHINNLNLNEIIFFFFLIQLNFNILAQYT